MNPKTFGTYEYVGLYLSNAVLSSEILIVVNMFTVSIVKSYIHIVPTWVYI